MEAAQQIPMKLACRSCGRALTLEEMHYYDDGDGAATCDNCEGEWMQEIADWKASSTDTMPPRQ